MLSSDTLDGLLAVAMFKSGRGDNARRADAREVVHAAAEELGLDPLAPTLPRFGAGEDVLRAAALRVLKVPKLEQTLAKHRARVAACQAAAERIGELQHRREQLVRNELGRMDDQIKAGKAPGPAPAEAIDELARLDAELALVGPQPGRVGEWVPAAERPLILEAVSPPDVLPSVIFYGELVCERLRLLTVNEHYKAPAARTRERCAPTESETMTARSVAVASITARASAANSASPYPVSGRSERPLPRPSKVITRQCRARYGICIFQCREWTIDHVGSRKTVGSPEP